MNDRLNKQKGFDEKGNAGPQSKGKPEENFPVENGGTSETDTAEIVSLMTVTNIL